MLNTKRPKKVGKGAMKRKMKGNGRKRHEMDMKWDRQKDRRESLGGGVMIRKMG